MTTNVDILFKELPASPAAPEKKNVSDISSNALARGEYDAEKSNNVGGTEKTFNEHLAEQPQSQKNTTEAQSYKDTTTDDAPAQGTSTPPGVKEQNKSDQETEESPQTPSENINQVSAKANIIASGGMQHLVVPTQVEGSSDNERKKGAILQTIPLNAPVTTDIPETQNINPVLDAVAKSTVAPNKEQGEAIKQSNPSAITPEQPSSATAHEPVIKTANVLSTPANTGAPALITEPTQTAMEVAHPVQLQATQQGISSPEISPVQAATTEKNVTSAQKTETIKGQEEAGPAPISKTTGQSGQSVAMENTAPTLMANVEVSNPLPEKQILESKIPTETVMVEATRTLPVAPVANPVTPQQNGVTKSTAATSKSNVKSAASAGAAANTQSSIATQNANGGQASSAASQLTNAFQSDIQLDLSGSGQKSEPAPLLSPAQTNQGQITTSGLLAAQDITLQKLSSSMPTATKTDAPAMTRMINEQITVAINRHVVNGQNNFNVRLHPAELGQVDIRLEFAADGKMQASMVVENERTLAMLQRDQSALEKALQDAGINLSNKNLNFSLKKQGEQNPDQDLAGNSNQPDDEELFDQVAMGGAMQHVSMGYSDQSLDISV